MVQLTPFPSSLGVILSAINSLIKLVEVWWLIVDELALYKYCGARFVGSCGVTVFISW
jgi:hypothetical protein